jgi:hypothetical protein
VVRKAGEQIDVWTAEVLKLKQDTCDTYGVLDQPPWDDEAGEQIETRWYVRPRGSVEADDGGSGAWVCVFDLPFDKYMDFEILFDAGHYWVKPVAFDEAEMDRRRAAFLQKKEEEPEF